MVYIPDSVRRRPPDARGRNVKAWYAPANSQRDLPKGTKSKAMDAFLMSDEVADISEQAAKDIADEARQDAASQGISESGEYISSFETERDFVVEVADPHPNPRRGARVGNNSKHAAAVEFGNRGREGKHILQRAGSKFDSPKGGPSA